MGSKRDMTAANWKRTVNKLRRLASELEAHDFEIREPANLDIPPGKRSGQAIASHSR